jgi:hypothetical protein
MIQQMAARSNIQTLISQWHTDPFLLGPFGWAQTAAWMHTFATKRGDTKKEIWVVPLCYQEVAAVF